MGAWGISQEIPQATRRLPTYESDMAGAMSGPPISEKVSGVGEMPSLLYYKGW